MYKLVAVIVVFMCIENVAGQFSRITDYLNNITVGDLSNLLRHLPISNPLLFDGFPLSRNDVTYWLYTRNNPNIPDILKRTSTRFGNLEPENEIKFIVHGWMESANRTYYRGLIDAYLTRGNYNVIGVDWSRPSLSEYTISARNTKTAGRELGDFIVKLNKNLGIPFEQIHILGHSLGAHLAGFAGKRVLSRTGSKIRRISALDAAGPLFESPIPVERNNRLDQNDAEFVDCIHTDGGIFGMVQPIGHADFYPNGGLPRQPGCSTINIRQLSSRVIIDDIIGGIIPLIEHTSNPDILHSLKPVFCSHTRSHDLFIESINSQMLLARACNSFDNFRAGFCNNGALAVMGEDTETSTRGKFYLMTNAVPPFGRG